MSIHLCRNRFLLHYENWVSVGGLKEWAMRHGLLSVPICLFSLLSCSFSPSSYQ